MHGSIELSILRAAEMQITELMGFSFFLVQHTQDTDGERKLSTPHDVSHTLASRHVTSHKECDHCS